MMPMDINTLYSFNELCTAARIRNQWNKKAENKEAAKFSDTCRYIGGHLIISAEMGNLHSVFPPFLL